MPKVTGGIAAAVLLTVSIALAGCGEETEAEPLKTGDASSSDSARSFVAQSTEESPTAEPDVVSDEADEVFLAYVLEETPDFVATALPDMSDAEKITAAHEACEQIAAGVPMVDLRLVPGEVETATGDYLDSSAIFNGALVAYCPELMIQPEG